MAVYVGAWLTDWLAYCVVSHHRSRVFYKVVYQDWPGTWGWGRKREDEYIFTVKKVGGGGGGGGRG